MNDNQRSKTMRGEKLVVFLGDNAGTLAPLANVATYKTQLENKIDEINTNDTAANIDTTGITETKNDESAEMVTSALKLVAFLKIHALQTNDKILNNLIDFKKSELTGKSDNDRRNAARYLAEKGAEPAIAAALAAMAPLAYTAADLAAHVTNVDEYDDLIGRPNEQRSVKSAYTKAVARNIVELDGIVENLRTAMAPVEFFDLTLFDQFEAAALIDDAPSNSSTHFVGTIDPSGEKKITTLVFEPNDELQLNNTGTSELEISFRDEDNNVLGTPTTVSVGETKVFLFSDLAPDGKAVWLKNLSTTITGNYILDLL
jgi:hypothetical protein